VTERRVQGDHRRGFGQPVALPKRNPHRGKPLRGVDAQRRAAGDKRSSPARRRPRAPWSRPACRPASTAATRAGGRHKPYRDVPRPPQPPRRACASSPAKAPTALHLLANLLEDPRHAHNHRGPDLAHGLRQLVELRAIGHLRPVGVHHVVQRARRNVRERQERDAGVRGEVEIRGRQCSGSRQCCRGSAPRPWARRWSRGVNQRGQVLGLHGAHQRVEDRIALAAAVIGPGQHLAEGNGSLGGAAESMITIRSKLVWPRTAFSLSNCWRVETTAMRQPASAPARPPARRSAWDRWAHHRADGQRGKVGDGPLPAVFAIRAMRSPFCAPQPRKAWASARTRW
jgi:hypothetical protein